MSAKLLRAAFLLMPTLGAVTLIAFSAPSAGKLPGPAPSSPVPPPSPSGPAPSPVAPPPTDTPALPPAAAPAATAPAAAKSAEPAVQVRTLSADGREVEVVATLPALPAEWNARLPEGGVPSRAGEAVLVFALLGEDGTPGAAMLGTWARTGATLVFRPSHPLVKGRTFRATLTLPDGRGGRVVRNVDHRPGAVAEAPPPQVTAVWPEGDTLPANLLRFTLHFSRPMREGRAIFEQIRILDADGREVVDPWRRIEAWSPDARRLTLWIHPGRVKQGVNLREELGPVLEPGRDYELVVDGTLADADGRPMGTPHRRKFRAGPADRTRPVPADWIVEPGTAGTRGPLVIRLPDALDRVLAEKLIAVRTAAGATLPGTVDMADAQRTWRFVPDAPWTAGSQHRITVDERLEDLAGNTPGRVFDRDLTEPEPTPPALERTFVPRPAAPTAR